MSTEAKKLLTITSNTNIINVIKHVQIDNIFNFVLKPLRKVFKLDPIFFLYTSPISFIKLFKELS